MLLNVSSISLKLTMLNYMGLKIKEVVINLKVLSQQKVPSELNLKSFEILVFVSFIEF